jgi:anti-sigma regulatory factor (Ser/Thr protein kinase)
MSPREELLLFRAAPDLVLEAVRWTESACARAGLDAGRARELGAAVIEAVNNSLEHGYGLVPGDVSLTLDADADSVVITITDRGSGLPPWPAQSEPAPFAERGRGSWIMQRTCDEVRHEIGTDTQCVVLVKRRAGPERTPNGDMS